MFMESKREINIAEVAERICAMWQPMNDRDRQLIARHLQLRHYKKNEAIYKEQDPHGDMMCLVRGKVKVYKEGMGRNQIIRVIKPIDLFGFRAYFANEDHKTNAVAFEPSLVASIPMDVVEEVMKECYALTRFIVTHLAKELGHSDDRTINLTQKHIRGRLAEALMFLKDSYGLEEDGCTLSIYLSREELANLSNMTTSNAIRTLSTFANEHLIVTDGRKIKIIQEEQLRKISKMG